MGRECSHRHDRGRRPFGRAAVAAFPLATATVAVFFYSAISIYRHDRFASDGYDLGIFDQTIWGYSRFEIVRNTVKGTPNLLGDHFHPALMALAPAYWIWNDARVLLVVQAVLLAVASLPIFYWGRSRLGTVGAACVQLAFLAFWGVLAGVIFDFHELALAVAAISFGIYALLERKPRLFWAMFGLGCLTKEDIALTFAAMGLYALVVQRRARFGLSVSAIAVGWFALTIGTIVPAISGRRYGYWNYPGLGQTWTKAVVTLAERPYRAVTLMFNRAPKRDTIVVLFGSWLFLPLASPLLLLAVPSLGERFWAHNPDFWGTRFQYSLPIAPVLAYAAIDGARRLGRARTGAAIAVMACGTVLSAVVVRPLEGLPEFMSPARAAATDACLDTIPPGAPMAASDRLIPHLTHRTDIRRLVRQAGEQYLAIAADGHPDDRVLLGLALAGRPLPPERVRYRLLCHRGDVTVLDATRGDCEGPAVTGTDIKRSHLRNPLVAVRTSSTGRPLPSSVDRRTPARYFSAIPRSPPGAGCNRVRRQGESDGRDGSLGRRCVGPQAGSSVAKDPNRDKGRSPQRRPDAARHRKRFRA